MNEEDLRSALTRSARRHRVPGAQLAVRVDTTVTAVEVGERRHGSGAPVTADSAFPLGSLTKPFTAVLAMTLVADGDVELDAPLGTYLPHPVPPVTLRQVLSHTSGLASAVPEATTGVTDPGRWVRAHCPPDALVHRPGAVFSYSNVGYLLVGHLVEVVTGMGWAEAVAAILLAPLGITPSFVVGAPTGRPPLAGHAVHGATGRVVPVRDQDLPVVEVAAGALALSAVDLVTFARAQGVDPELPGPLDGDALAAMRVDHTAGTAVGPFGLADGWGLGWSVHRRSGRSWFGHDGTGSGTSTHLRFDPGSGTVVAFTANAGAGLAAWGDLVDDLRAGGLDVGDHRGSTPAAAGRSAAAAGCAGRFTNGDTEITTRAGAGDRLELAVDGTPFGELSLVEGLRFVLREFGSGAVYTGQFLAGDGPGDPEGIQLVGRLARRSG